MLKSNEKLRKFSLRENKLKLLLRSKSFLNYSLFIRRCALHTEQYIRRWAKPIEQYIPKIEDFRAIYALCTLHFEFLMSTIIRRIFIFPIRFYQKHISPYRARCCRFYPTCSAYAVEAIEKRGVFVGLILSAWRLLRCNPFGGSGYDPVPEKGFRRKHGDNTKQEYD